MPMKDLAITTYLHVIISVYDIGATNEVVAQDNEKSTSSFLKDELNNCNTIGRNFFCRKLVKRRSSIYDSCELALFYKVTHRLKQWFPIWGSRPPGGSLAKHLSFKNAIKH